MPLKIENHTEIHAFNIFARYRRRQIFIRNPVRSLKNAVRRENDDILSVTTTRKRVTNEILSRKNR